MARVPRRPTARNPRDLGTAAEASLVRRGGYATTPNSGASSAKGDLRRGEWMIEVKSTVHDGYRVTAETLAKLRNDGLTNGRPGALIVTLGDGTKLAVLDLVLFESLTEEP